MDKNIKVYGTKKTYLEIKHLIKTARDTVYRTANFEMIKTYWEIGKRIVQQEQNGVDRAEYGRYLIKELSIRLNKEFGQGFGASNLWNMRQFHLAYPIIDAVRRELSWTHYRVLMRVSNPEARVYYEQESVEQNWSSRALERQIGTYYYERLRASRKKDAVIAEARENVKDLKMRTGDIIKSPYMLEFLDMHPDTEYLEKDIEKGLINKLQELLLELGKGFAFVARQKRVSTDHREYYIDLVFYNYLLKCFVLVDLKNGPLTHQDVGQMDGYVRLYDEKIKPKEDNPTLGIILCTENDETVFRYSMLKDSKQIFSSKYMTYLPNEEELKREILREKQLIELEKRE
jgi:predicted nuclease of restriction endonuclease-like (RecB) superfamily